MRACGVFGVLLLHLFAVSSQTYNNYQLPPPELDLIPPEPQPALFFNAQLEFDTNQIQQAATAQQTISYQAPKYLPPTPTQQYQSNPNLQYLPPYQPQQVQVQKSIELQYYEGPKYLPPAQPAQYQAPAYLPPAPQPRQSYYQMSLALPEGYDFVKPAGAEAAIAELHTLPADEAPVPVSVPDYNTIQNGKIRTVQIVNESAVKTWKILETNENGVRTIKILGSSSETPNGEHHVVKVQLPGSKPQIVKVYHDNQNVGNFNQYLPPTVSRTTHKRSVRVSNEGYYTQVQQ